MGKKEWLINMFLIFCFTSGYTDIKEKSIGLHPKYAISELHMDHWTYKDGLVSNNINDIYQTKDHFIWMTSYGGLQKFDGLDFSKYSHHNENSFKSSSVYALFEGKDQNTWITTRSSGLLGYNNGKFFSYQQNDSLPKAAMSVLESSKGDFWIGTSNSGLYLKKSNSTFKQVSSIPEIRISTMIEDDQGSIWVGTQGKGLYRISNDSTSRFSMLDGLTSDIIGSLHQDTNGDIYVGTVNGLAIVRNGKVIKKPLFDGHEINDILIDNYGSLWIASGQGLIRENIEYGTFEFFTKEQGLPGIRLTTLCLDHEGSLWVGTYNVGMLRFKLTQITSLTSENGLSFNKVNIISKSEKQFYIGTEDGKINIFDDNIFNSISPNFNLHKTGIRDFLFDKSGAIWVASYDGITRSSKNEETNFTLGNGLPSNDARRIFQAKDSSIWIGTRSGGLIKFNDSGNHVYYNKNNGLGSDFVLSIEEDLKGNIIVGTNAGGLSIIDASGKVSTIPIMIDDSELVIFNTHVDSFNNLWLCTNIGIYLYDYNSFRKIDFNSILPAQKFFDFIDDQIGGVWLSTDIGIVKVEKQELTDFVAGKISKVNTRILNESDGMITRECTGATRSFFDSETGNIWIPTYEGVVIINPKMNIINDVVPKIYILSAKVDNQVIDIYKEDIKIKPGAFRYAFNFTSLSYISPAHIKFKYKLDGIDDEWRMLTGKRSVEYTNLPYGSYTINIKGSNGYNVWNEQGASLSFEVMPFFYERISFYVLIVLLLGAIIFGLTRWRMNDIKQSNKSLIKINKELDNFVYRASHDLRSPVTSTMGLVDIALKERSVDEKNMYFELIDQCAHKLDQIIMDIIEYSKNKNEDVDHSKFSASSLINEVLEDFKFLDQKDKINIEKDIQRDIISGDEFRIKIVISNLLLNAIHYADLDKNDPRVNICIDQDKTNTRITVKDNGLGIESNQFDKIFNMFYRGNDISKGSGLGLYIVKETTDKLNGRIEMKSTLGIGTEFEINIPRGSS